MERKGFVEGRRLHIVAVIMLGVMVLTRYHHFGSALHLPDASWALFIAGGFYLYHGRWLALFLAAAAVIDYFAITQGGSGYCLSPAYPFLIPAYAVLWWGGRWLARRYRGDGGDLLALSLMALVVTTLCFAISNGAFYWFSGRIEQPSFSGHVSGFFRYYPMFLRTTLVYLAVIAALHAIALVLREIFGDDAMEGTSDGR